MLRAITVALVALALAPAAAAHAPTTAIGRAVIALREVPVSYDPESELTELEADGLVPVERADHRVRVAVMPSAALTEIAGGPQAVASEIAREAQLDGTLVVLVGRRLAGWSDTIGDERLRELTAEAAATYPRGPYAARVADLVARVSAEPVDEGAPWGVIAAVVGALALLALGVVALRTRTSSRAPAAMRDGS